MSGTVVTEEQPEARIDVRVKGPMAAHLASVIGSNGLYENQSEYIRDLIRHDMADRPADDLAAGLLEGYAQLAAGDYRKRDMSEIVERAEREMRAEADA